MDKYDRLIKKYYTILNNTWKNEVKKAVKEAIKTLVQAKENGSLDTIDDLMEFSTKNISESLKAELNKDSKEFVQSIYKLSFEDTYKSVNSSVGILGLKQKNIISTYVKQQLFWIGTHFEDNVASRLKNRLVEALDENISKDSFKELLKREFKDLGRSDVYWRGLAENTTTRVKELASASAYKNLGIKALEIVAVIDDKTSDICLEMNGRIIPVSTMSNIADSLLEVEPDSNSKEKVKKLTPFFDSAKDLKGLSTAEIMKKFPSLSLPPFHWRCRTRTAPILGKIKGEIRKGNRANRKKDKILRTLTDKEVINKLNSIKLIKYFKYNEVDFLDDVKKHGEDEFGLKPWEYKQKAQDIINNYDKITARTYNDNLQFSFYSFKEKGYTVVDLKGVIHGCYGHLKSNGLDKCFKYNKEKTFIVKEG